MSLIFKRPEECIYLSIDKLKISFFSKIFLQSGILVDIEVHSLRTYSNGVRRQTELLPLFDEFD